MSRKHVLNESTLCSSGLMSRDRSLVTENSKASSRHTDRNHATSSLITHIGEVNRINSSKHELTKLETRWGIRLLFLVGRISSMLVMCKSQAFQNTETLQPDTQSVSESMQPPREFSGTMFLTLVKLVSQAASGKHGLGVTT